MTLRDLKARHARGVMTSPDYNGEMVTFVPKEGTERSVRAVVRRQDPEGAEPNVPQVSRQRALVSIPNDATLGITSWQLGDAILLALRLGEDPTQARIRRLVSQNEGFFTFEVEG